MKKKFLEDMYETVFQKVDNVCRFDWQNTLCDKSIYKDYKEYREVKIRETLQHFNHFAKEKGHIR